MSRFPFYEVKLLYLLFFLISYLFSLYLYSPSLNYYFFQDDFFEINISKAASFQEYLFLFKFRDDIIAYRPLSLQNYFFLSGSLFGANPVGFRLITFILFFASGFLLAKVTSAIFRSYKAGVLAAFLWLTSAVHFMSLTWIAAAYNIIGTFFWLLTALLFLKFTKTQKSIFYSLCLLSFILTVGSYEFSITWPAIFGFYYFLIAKKSAIKTIKVFLPFIIISLVYLVARFLFIKIPQIPEYQLTLSLESAKSLFWYLLWSFNIPEELKKQAVSNIIGFNPIFLAEFWGLVVKSFTSLLWIITLGILIPIVTVIRIKAPIDLKLISFCVIFFLLAISPVLILPNHTFSMYLTLASAGISFLLAYFLILSKSQILTVATIIIWVTSSATTLSFYKHNSWMIEAQKTARTFADEIKSQFPGLPPNSVVYYYLPYWWQHQALSEQNAIKAIYNDKSISVYYNIEDIKSTQTTRGRPVYIY